MKTIFKKFLFGFAVAGMSFVGALLLLGGEKRTSLPAVVAESLPATLDAGVSGKTGVAGLTQNTSKSTQVESVAQVQSSAVAPVSNVTEDISKSIAKEIIDKNPDGPLQQNDIPQITARDPKALVDSIYKEQMSKIKPEDFEEKIPTDSLAQNSGSPEEKVTFRTEFAKANEELLNIKIDFSAGEEDAARDTASALQQALAHFKAISVPREYAANYARFLELLGTEKNIYFAIADASRDAFRAMVAFQILEPVKNAAESWYQTAIIPITKQP